QSLPTGDRGENLKKAIESFQNALRTYSETAFPYEYAMTQNNLGTAYSALPTGDRGENLKKAIESFRNALRIRTETAFPQDRVNTLYNLTLTYDKLEYLQNAYTTCSEAIHVLEKYVRAVSSEETRRALAENQAKIYHRMVSLCIRLSRFQEALSCAERGKSRTLVEMLHSAELMPSEKVPEDMRAAFVSVRKKIEELRQSEQREGISQPHTDPQGERHASSSPAIPRPRNRETLAMIEQTREKYQNLLKQIRELDPEFAASEQVQPISASEIQQQIPAGTVFAECFTGYDGTYIFLLDGKNDISESCLVLKDLTAKELNRMVEEHWLSPYRQRGKSRENWHQAIENISSLLAEKFWYAEDQNGRSLDDMVLEQNPERIVFLPHSGLHLLPLHLMPVRDERQGARGVRLMDRYEIAYAPSASLLRIILRRERKSPEHLFAAANPDRSLVFTDIEVENIAGRFPNSQVLWHEETGRAAVLKHAGKGDTVHFSCHGQFDFKNPLNSELSLTDSPLTLKDIFAELRLPRTEIAVLSACETGMVELEAGDEYVGLPSGFLFAGACSVVSALWSVDDFSTHLLMQTFYDNMRSRNMGKAAALRAAQHQMRDMQAREIRPHLERHIENAERQGHSASLRIQGMHITYNALSDNERPFTHPYYWGAFVCSGNWE
ncbi:MAG TPA: CHAT domain-containing protein, partial [Desulfobacterales bacterium]|nr:CHAT domain-containing protein [Desulfobacterales bacterium]